MSKQKGQAALIILMVSAVLMTLGLSAARSNVVDTKVDTDQESYRVAFDSAESGVEYFLGTGQTGLATNNTNTQYEINDINKDSSLNGNLEYQQMFARGERVNVWLVGRQENGDFDYNNVFGGSDFKVCVPNGYNGQLYWEYYSKNGGSYKVDRVVTTPSGANDSCNTGWREVLNQATGSDTPFLGSLMILNSPTRVRFNFPGSVNLPSQGKMAKVTSVAGEESSGVRVSLKVEQRYEVPEVLFQALSSLGDIQ